MTKNEAASVAQLTDEGAMRIALNIMANLEDRSGVLDGVDDETKADIADEIAVTILAQAAPPAAPVPDAGLKAAADFIQRKADDYAREFGSGDMGSLSFGNDAMRDYHWGLLELADEIRALAALAAAPPSRRMFDAEELLHDAWWFIQLYAEANPKFMNAGRLQDPCGAHRWLQRYDEFFPEPAKPEGV